MNKKRKIAILLILIGIGIPLILFFFQEDNVLYEIYGTKEVKRELTPGEISAIKKTKERAKSIMPEQERRRYEIYESWIKSTYGEDYFLNGYSFEIRTHTYLPIQYRNCVGVGIIFIFIGMGIFIFSFFPKAVKPKKE